MRPVHTYDVPIPRRVGFFARFFSFYSFFLVHLLGSSCPYSSSPLRFSAQSTRPSLSIITAVAITEGLRFPPYIAATFLF